MKSCRFSKTCDSYSEDNPFCFISGVKGNTCPVYKKTSYEIRNIRYRQVCLK